MTKSLVTAASNGSTVPDLMTIMCHLTCSTSFGLAQRKIYGIQTNSTLWANDGMISGMEKLMSSERTCPSTNLSITISCWPLWTEPQHPQWEADDWLTLPSHMSPVFCQCVCSMCKILNSYLCWNYLSQQDCQSLLIHQWATSYILFHPLSDNSQLSTAINYMFIMWYYKRF